MTTRIEIEEDVVRELVKELGDMALAYLPVPLVTTSVGGSTTTLKDIKLARGSRDANAYDNRAIMVSEFDDGDADIRSIAVVTTGGFDGSQLLTYSPAFNAATADGAAKASEGRPAQFPVLSNSISKTSVAPPGITRRDPDAP